MITLAHIRRVGRPLLAVFGVAGALLIGPSSVAAPVTAAAETLVPPRVEMPAGAEPAGPSTFWGIRAPDGSVFTVEKYDAPGPGRHPTVVLFHGSGGWTTADERHAAMYPAQGFTAVSVCWFRNKSVPDPGQVACPEAPPFVGVSAAGLGAMDALLDGVRHLPGVDPARMALRGFSRGGGEALLIGSQGGPEPIISVSGLVDPKTFFYKLPGETDVITRAATVRAPTLIAYGIDDDYVAWRTNSLAMANALRAAGTAPEPVLVGYSGRHLVDVIADPVMGTAPDARRLFADEVAFLRSTLRSAGPRQ